MEINSLELVQTVDFLRVCQKSANLKPYKKPILKDHSENLAKSWFVEFYFWSESDQALKRKRLTNIPGITSPNRSKTLREVIARFFTDTTTVLARFALPCKAPLRPPITPFTIDDIILNAITYIFSLLKGSAVVLLK